MLKELLKAENTREGKHLTITNPKLLRKWLIGTHMSITTLNVNGLNAPTKRHTLPEWIQK